MKTSSHPRWEGKRKTKDAWSPEKSPFQNRNLEFPDFTFTTECSPFKYTQILVPAY